MSTVYDEDGQTNCEKDDHDNDVVELILDYMHVNAKSFRMVRDQSNKNVDVVRV